MRLSARAAWIGALFLGGCSGMVGLTSEMGDADGVIYHLPKSLLTITVRQYKDLQAGRVFYTLGGPGQAAATGAGEIPAREIISETIPDPTQKYTIQYHRSAFSDDRLCISRKPNGLLYDVQFAADDRTPEVVFNIARFIGGFIGSPAAPTAFLPSETGGGENKIEVRAYTARVDPFDPDDVGTYNNALEHIFRQPLRIDFSRMREMLKASADTWPTGCGLKDTCAWEILAKRCDADHICYRTALELPVDLELNNRAIDMKYAKIINALDVGSISVTRALLVQKITKLRFEDGALVSAIIRKPSEVEEASLLPLNVMNAILSVPTGLWAAAFSDQNAKAAALSQLAKQEAQIAQLNENQRNLRLQGAAPIEAGTAENYNLNCVSGKRSNFINILKDDG